jgi:hypothetical protein
MPQELILMSNFDTKKINGAKSSFPKAKFEGQEPVLIVMDYALVSKLTEIIELLKPFKKDILLNVESVSIMGKAGILEGGKEIS